MAQTNESQEQVTVNVETLQPVTRTLMTIGALPTSYLISMTYEEQLLWLQNYLIKTVIPAINNNAEATKEVQDIVMALQDYINTQFSEMNLQEYIDNKLDEMLESGVFENILMDYVQLTKVYDTYNDMMLDTSTYVTGMKLKTLGYHSINDGGGADYIVTSTASSTHYQISIGVNKYIELIDPNIIRPELFGAIGDGITNDTNAFISMLSYVKSKQVKINNELVTPNMYLYKKYYIDTINVPDNMSMTNFIGNGAFIINGGFTFSSSSGWRTRFENITFLNCHNPIYFEYRNLEYGKYIISNCIFASCSGTAITIKRRSCTSIIEKCTFRGCEKSVFVEDNDMFIFRSNWLECSTAWENDHYDVEQYAPNEGSCVIENNLFIPGYNQSAHNPCWIKIGRNANILNNRFSGENATIHPVYITYDNVNNFNFNSSLFPIINILNNPMIAGNTDILIGNCRGRINLENNSGYAVGKKIMSLYDESLSEIYNNLERKYLTISFNNNGGRTFIFRDSENNHLPNAYKPSVSESLYKFIKTKQLFAENSNFREPEIVSQSRYEIEIKYFTKNPDEIKYLLLSGIANKNPGGGGYRDNILILIGFHRYFDTELRYKPVLKVISAAPDIINESSFNVTVNNSEYITDFNDLDVVKISTVSPLAVTFTNKKYLELEPLHSTLNN